MADQITLTSKLGSFTFDKDVLFSHAKLIRDCVTGQFFAPKPGSRKVRTEDDVYSYVRNDLHAALAIVPFEVIINPLGKR